jgi:S-adenosylmethionine:tRNA ribosyltransferase-isomerase
VDRHRLLRPLDRLHDLNTHDRLGDYDYALPPELIAQQPLPARSASRLLRLARTGGAPRDLRMADLPGELAPGDLLVFNDTRVVPARVMGRKASGGQVEIFLERVLPGDGRHALVQLRASKSLRPGMPIATAGGELQLVALAGSMWEVQTPGDALAFFEAHGRVPLPPYITRAPDENDRERYQTLFARTPGAVAAPTASLHFDAPLLAALEARGIRRALLTLHVGAGTFQPVRSESLDEHRMHPERYDIPPELVATIAATRAAGRRVVAVGTTVVRALETAAEAAAAAGATELLQAGAGESRLFIRPGFRFRIVDAMLTNFHLPKSTLLMLVSAFAGRDAVRAAYEHAVRERYRFFSYGDAMLIAD